MRARRVRKLIRIEVLGLLAVAAVATVAAIPAVSADHLDAPTVKKDGRTDINDVYVFHPGASQNLNRTVLAMTVNPAAGVISGTTFRPGARYELLIDTNGNARPDITIRTQFSSVENGQQDYTVRRIKGDDSKVIARGETNEVESEDGVKAFAGLRDDPFFFDLAAFNAGAAFCPGGVGTDFFLGLNTSVIAVEVPTSMIGSGAVGVWGRTVVGGDQIERMGRPAILTVFIPPNPFEAGSTADGNLEDQFNRTTPNRDQARWRNEVVNSLTLLYSLNDGTDDPSDDAGKIQGLANILLPDILTVDLSKATGFLNGRGLADDVIDAELGLITEGLITTDCVNNDSTFLSGFPYLGAPN
ncbi:MAG: DUF4331 family protein [Gaiellaceae bacterium]